MSMLTPSFSRPLNQQKQYYRTNIRSDAAIEDDIWYRLEKASGLSWTSLEHIDIEVENGTVQLSGHVTKGWHRQRLEEIAASVWGVAGVQNEIIQDEEIQAQVLMALASDDMTTIYFFPVKCSFGWISLGGMVPAQEIALRAEEVAAHIPTVRGIIGLPWVVSIPWIGDSQPETARRTFQPRLCSAVYEERNGNKHGEAGMVSQIIMDPANRLVSHIAVRTWQLVKDRKVSSDHLLPIDVVEAVSDSAVWLKEGEEACRHPEFHPEQCPLPPADWRPPFPYKHGQVRWREI